MLHVDYEEMIGLTPQTSVPFTPSPAHSIDRPQQYMPTCTCHQGKGVPYQCIDRFHLLPLRISSNSDVPNNRHNNLPLSSHQLAPVSPKVQTDNEYLQRTWPTIIDRVQHYRESRPCKRTLQTTRFRLVTAVGAYPQYCSTRLVCSPCCTVPRTQKYQLVTEVSHINNIADCAAVCLFAICAFVLN